MAIPYFGDVEVERLLATSETRFVDDRPAVTARWWDHRSPEEVRVSTEREEFEDALRSAWHRANDPGRLLRELMEDC